MIVTIASRHMEVTPALKAHAEERAKRLLKYFDRIQEIEVVFEASGKDRVTVEFIVNAEHNHIFLAKQDDGDAYANIDGCLHKLERQLTDHKEKLRNRKHPDIAPS